MALICTCDNYLRFRAPSRTRRTKELRSQGREVVVCSIGLHDLVSGPFLALSWSDRFSSAVNLCPANITTLSYNGPGSKSDTRQ